MKKRFIYAFLLLLAVILHAEARTPMRQWLVAMPDSVMPLLTKNNRMDFIDFYDAQMAAVVTNRMDGSSRMNRLTDDYVQIRYTGSTDVEMKLLPVNDSTDVLCMVTTVRDAVDDSRIAFFDTEWKPLSVESYLTEPRIEDFCSTEQSNSAAQAWSKLDIFFRTYRLCAESTELQCVLTAMDYLSEEDREEVAPYVRKEPITYRWTGNGYEPYE